MLLAAGVVGLGVAAALPFCAAGVGAAALGLAAVAGVLGGGALFCVVAGVACTLPAALATAGVLGVFGGACATVSNAPRRGAKKC